MNLGIQLDTAVAVLFAMSPSASGRWDSPYRNIAGCDVWDRERDATQYRGPHPVIAHPPCRAWGKLQHFATPREGERGLGSFAVAAVRRFGGVLEHPEGSELWSFHGLPKPKGPVDPFGGWTLPIKQFHWGHRCEKATWLYIVGCPRCAIPAIPFRAGSPTHLIAGGLKSVTGKSQVSHFERMHTPPELAEWLVTLARRCSI